MFPLLSKQLMEKELEPRLNSKCILAKANYKCLNFSLLNSCFKRTSWPAFSSANISKQSKPHHGKQKLCLGKVAGTALQTDPQTAPGGAAVFFLPSWYLTAHKLQDTICPVLPLHHGTVSFWYPCCLLQDVKYH